MSITPAKPAVAGTFTGTHMLFTLIGFFGVIVSVNVVMAIAASSTWTGLVVQNSYVASQEFQEKLEAHRQQAGLGWIATLNYTPGAAQFTIRDGAGNAVDLGPVTLQVNRPVGDKFDQKVMLERGPEGGYAAVLQLAPGVWDATIIAAETAQGPFELHERFTVGE